MRYYPSNKIETDLYTRGNELMLELTSQPYVGWYWKLSNGDMFIGKNPSFKPKRKLIKIDESKVETDKPFNLNKYVKNSKTNPYLKTRIDISPKFLPQPYYPQPNEDIIEFERYFLKRIGMELYVEVDENTFQKILSQDENWSYHLFIPFSIPWKIKGNVEEVLKTNQYWVNKISKEFRLKKFNEFLSNNYIKFGRF